MNTNLSPSSFHTPSKTLRSRLSLTGIAVLAAFVGGLSFIGAPGALAADGSPSLKTEIDRTAPTTQTHEQKINRSPEAMAKRVEERIKTLHEKLGITSEQEVNWGDVALAMRDNEAAIGALVETRHKNAKDMSAVDDLESYREITQAHADGIKKLIVPFQKLYADMSDDQKKAADEAFGRFEGHRGHSAKKHN